MNAPTVTIDIPAYDVRPIGPTPIVVAVARFGSSGVAFDVVATFVARPGTSTIDRIRRADAFAVARFGRSNVGRTVAGTRDGRPFPATYPGDGPAIVVPVRP